MKLHATITNENGKTISKGGNKRLNILLKDGNTEICRVLLDLTGIGIYISNPEYIFTSGNYQQQFLSKSKKLQSKCAKNHYPRTLIYNKEYCNSCGQEQH